MKRFYLFGLIVALIYGCGGHAPKKSGFKGRYPSKEEVLVGEINRGDLLTPPHNQWFIPRYDRYHPDQDAMAAIKASLDEIDSIQVFLGTWCIDSRIEIPKLFKVLDEHDYSSERVKMTGLKFSKTATDNLQDSYGIIMIPTIIVYKDGKELNRFVEYSQVSFEDDFAKIVSGAEYRHSYLK